VITFPESAQGSDQIRVGGGLHCSVNLVCNWWSSWMFILWMFTLSRM